MFSTCFIEPEPDRDGLLFTSLGGAFGLGSSDCRFAAFGAPFVSLQIKREDDENVVNENVKVTN